MKKVDEALSGLGAHDAGGDPALRELFDQARSDGLTRAQTEALWGHVAAGVGVSVGALGLQPSAGGAGLSGGGSILLKGAAWILLGTTVMAGAGLATVGVGGRELRAGAASSSAAIPASAPPTGALAVREAHDLDSIPATEPAGELAIPAPNRSPRAAAPPRVPAREPSGPEVRLGAAPAVRNIEAHRGSEEASPSRLEPAAPVGLTRDSSVAPEAMPPPRVSSAVDSTATAPAPAEGALLLRARQVLPSDPAAALALTREHARRFPNGVLVPEREVLSIEALAGLGRFDEADARLAAFRARYPASPHLARLQALVRR